MIEGYDDYIKAGKIASEARNFGEKLIKIDASWLEVTESIEDRIAKLGGVCAFPTQISMNNLAAHSCPDKDDKTLFQKGDLVKLDIGVHINGYVADTAVTIDLGENKELTAASKNALNEALKIIRPGVTLGEIGATIQNEITSLGFSPIKNLSGHAVGKYIIHGPPSIPNYNTNDKTQLEEDTIIAIEPFATNGAGKIYEKDHANIFMQVGKKAVRSNMSREVLQTIQTYKGLPFCQRWLEKKHQSLTVRFALKDLLTQGIIKDFPPLPEMNNGLVSQHEHTVIVKDKPVITTI